MTLIWVWHPPTIIYFLFFAFRIFIIYNVLLFLELFKSKLNLPSNIWDRPWFWFCRKRGSSGDSRLPSLHGRSTPSHSRVLKKKKTRWNTFEEEEGRLSFLLWSTQSSSKESHKGKCLFNWQKNLFLFIFNELLSQTQQSAAGPALFNNAAFTWGILIKPRLSPHLGNFGERRRLILQMPFSSVGVYHVERRWRVRQKSDITFKLSVWSEI